MQETVKNADVLASFCSDHSPIIFTFAFEPNNKRLKGLLKFNKSLLSNDEYTNKLKNHISTSLSILNQKDIKDDQIRWEYIKFEIRQFLIRFFKKLSRSWNAEREILERELNDSEKSGWSYSDNEDCLVCKTKLDKIYDKKVEGLRIRSKCGWYEKWEKSTKFFLTLEKRHAIQNQIKALVVNDEVVKGQRSCKRTNWNQ